jgi:hypothetical protein
VPDVKATTPIHQALARRDLLPAEHYLDSGYPSAQTITDALCTYGLTLVTPPLHDSPPRPALAAGSTRALSASTGMPGLEASVASFRRWLRANLPEQARRASVTVLGEAPSPGQEAQVDYGKLGMWTEPRTGKRVTVWAFVMVLACSRHMFVYPVLKMDQQACSDAHVAAFGFFDGVPARIVPDNLATGVTKADLYDPKINRSYAELAEHYRVLIDPARSGKPKDKPRVERPMPYVRDSFWRGREFVSLQQMQAAAIDWCRDVAGQRRCRPLDGACPAAVFAAGRS